MPFEKGNKYGIGRPKVSLTKPELLLPVVFGNSCINWANDFCRLYKAIRERDLTQVEYKHLKLIMELLPYLCTKVQLKELDSQKMTNSADSLASANQTTRLLKALEDESNAGPTPQSKGD